MSNAKKIRIIVGIFLLALLAVYLLAICLNSNMLSSESGNISNRLLFSVGCINMLLTITFGYLLYKK